MKISKRRLKSVKCVLGKVALNKIVPRKDFIRKFPLV